MVIVKEKSEKKICEGAMNPELLDKKQLFPVTELVVSWLNGSRVIWDQGDRYKMEVNLASKRVTIESPKANIILFYGKTINVSRSGSAIRIVTDFFNLTANVAGLSLVTKLSVGVS